jgi:hypothetical protein
VAQSKAQRRLSRRSDLHDRIALGQTAVIENVGMDEFRDVDNRLFLISDLGFGIWD